MKDVLFLSNGHGEDTIARRLIDALRATYPDLSIDAWPMVGEGTAYRDGEIECVGAENVLPSEGFATLDARLMLRDIGAGWIGTHWKQYQAARSMRGRYRAVVAVGDIIPLMAASVIDAPTFFVGCAKSAYYRSAAYRYNALERRLMRRCRRVFPRDELTARQLGRGGIPVRYLGNPMMDGLDGMSAPLGIDGGASVVAVLPGTRDDAANNVMDLLGFLAPLAAHFQNPQDTVLAFALVPGIDLGELSAKAANACAPHVWKVDETAADDGVPGRVLSLVGPRGLRALMLEGRFADILHRSSLAVGMAGTANEQAVGLGLPLVAVPSQGVQGQRFVAMKAEYFGHAAVSCDRNAERISAAAAKLLADPTLRAQMGAAGRERMGGPGASAAIAQEIAEFLN